MRMPVNLMMAIGKAALNQAGFGLIGDAVEIAKAAWEDWKKSPEERIKELEDLIQADDAEVERAAENVAGELAAGQSEPIRMKLATFLKQIPDRVRQSQCRPDDSTGRTIQPGFVVSRPEDLIPFVPDQLPRSHPGDRPADAAVPVEKLNALLDPPVDPVKPEKSSGTTGSSSQYTL